MNWGKPKRKLSAVEAHANAVCRFLPVASQAEVSGHLVGSTAFKAAETSDPRLAGSIPVHLRQTTCVPWVVPAKDALIGHQRSVPSPARARRGRTLRRSSGEVSPSPALAR